MVGISQKMIGARYVFASFFVTVVAIVALSIVSTPTVIVEMTDQGFVPNEIEIQQGTKVRFQNTGTTPHWPAANIHPTHARYPGSDARKCGTPEEPLLFDSCRGVEPGGAYDFVFERSGIWGLHDHLFPQLSGGIKVLSNPEYRSPFYRTAYENILKFPAVATNFFLTLPENILITLGATLGAPVPAPLYGPYTAAELSVDKDYKNMPFLPIMSNDLEVSRMIAHIGTQQTVKKMFAEHDNQHNAQCHLGAHTIGRNAFNLYGIDALSSCEMTCHAGCFHGVMEVLGMTEEPKKLFSELVATCDSYDTVFKRYQCFHGVGHGFYLYMQNNLPKALEHCRELGTEAGRDACYGGVFMENLDTDDGSAPDPRTAWVSDTDMRYPCTLFADDETTLRWCYELQSEYMLQLLRDYDKATEVCLASPESVIGTCFKALGRVRAARDLSNPGYLESFCNTVPEKYFDECILGGAKMVIDFPGPDPSGAPVSYCKGLVGQQAKTVCYQRYTQNITEMFPISDSDTRLRICSLFETPHDALCVRVQTRVTN